MLRLIEGTTCKVKINVTNKKYVSEEYVEFDTSNVLFILGGAFVGLEKVIERRVKSNSNIGFGANIISEADRRKNIMSKATPKDFIDYGLIPEFMGRLPIIGVLNKLDNTELLSVLRDIKGSIVSQYQTLLAAEELDLEFTEQFLLDLLDAADSQGMGARSLRSVLDSTLISVMFRAPELKKKGVTQITFTEFGQAANAQAERQRRCR